MNKRTCNKCGALFENEVRTRADQALRMHMLRKHGSLRRYQGRRLEAKPKRKWTRRAKPDDGLAVRYCPCCGLDLLALSVAISTVKQIPRK